jgi:hypothetical protein
LQWLFDAKLARFSLHCKQGGIVSSDYSFIKLPNKVWELNLNGSEWKVLCRILMRAGMDGEFYESQVTTSKACDLCLRKLRDCVAQLERQKIIVVDRRPGEGKPNSIRVNDIALWESKAEKPKRLPPDKKYLPSPGIKGPTPRQESIYPPGKICTTPPAQKYLLSRSHELDPIELDPLNIADDLSVTAPDEVIEAEIVDEMPYAKKTRKQPRGEKKAVKKDKGLPTPVTEAWRAYLEAFRGKYGVDPIRNARVMGQVKQFIDRVGQADAPDILRFYLQQHDRWTVQNGHTVGVALQQAEKLAAGYRGAKMMTEKEARRIDEKQTTANILEAYEARKEDYFEF